MILPSSECELWWILRNVRFSIKKHNLRRKERGIRRPIFETRDDIKYTEMARRVTCSRYTALSTSELLSHPCIKPGTTVYAIILKVCAYETCLDLHRHWVISPGAIGLGVARKRSRAATVPDQVD